MAEPKRLWDRARDLRVGLAMTRKSSKVLCAIRKKVPLFPIIPVVPLGLFAANAIALITLFRRVRRIEAHAQYA